MKRVVKLKGQDGKEYSSTVDDSTKDYERLINFLKSSGYVHTMNGIPSRMQYTILDTENPIPTTDNRGEYVRVKCTAPGCSVGFVHTGGGFVMCKVCGGDGTVPVPKKQVDRIIEDLNL